MMDGSTALAAGRHPRFGRWLWRIVALAVVARGAILVTAERMPSRFDFPDSHRYVLVARNIAAGLGPVESDAIRAGTDPLYPAILAAGVLLGCDAEAAVMRFGRIVNAVLGVISVALLAAFARRVVGDRAALAAAGILAVDPILLFFNALVLTETTYIVLLLAGFYTATRVGERAGWLWAALCGLLVGLATLTRSSSLFMPVVLVPFVWHFAGGRGRAPTSGGARACGRPSPTPGVDGAPAYTACRGRRRRILLAACFLLLAASSLVPTVTRNWRLFDRFVPARTGNGASLMEALGPWADGGPGMERIDYPAVPADADETARDRIYRGAALEWARSHLGETLSLAWAKLRRTWSVGINASSYSSWRYDLVAWMTVGPEFVLAACGIWVLRRRPAVVGLLLIVAIYFTVVHMVFVGSVRYRVPAMPFLFVLAGAAVDRLGGRMVGRRAA